jgi:hypothetical protein
MGAEANPGVGAGARRSTDLIQTIRCWLGGAWWRRPSGRGGRRPDVLLDPDLGPSQVRIVVGAVPLANPMCGLVGEQIGESQRAQAVLLAKMDG